LQNRRNVIYSLLILCLLGGFFTGRAFFFNLSYLLGILLTLSLLWSWASVSAIQINRQTRARRTQVGKTLDEFFGVRNSGLLPKLWLEVRDHSDLPGHHPSSVVPTLMPRQSFQWTTRTTCIVRGEFTLGPMTLVSGDPFGFFQSSRYIGATSRVLVYPAAVPIYDFAPPSGVLSGGDARRQRTHQVTTNAAGIREYAPGDSFNRIHWKSTARKDKLLVKEFELDPIADTWILLDLYGGAAFARPYSIEGGVTSDLFIPPTTTEYAIVTATSLATYFISKEKTLGFGVYSPARQVMQPDRGYRQLVRIMEVLALAREGSIPFGQIVATEGHHMGRGITAILISPDPSEAWINEAHAMARRGVRVIAVIFDPASFGAPRGIPTAEQTRARLESGGVITYTVQQGDNLSAVLSQRRETVR